MQEHEGLVFFGSVVEVERFEWDFTDRPNGKRGTSYFAYVRANAASQRDAAQRITVTAEQFGRISEGDVVAWPVEIKLDAYEGRRPKIKWSLPEDFSTRPGVHAVSSY